MLQHLFLALTFVAMNPRVIVDPFYGYDAMLGCVTTCGCIFFITLIIVGCAFLVAL